MPLTLDEPGFEVVVNGMIGIFPSLEHCDGVGQNSDWEELSDRIIEFQDGINASGVSVALRFHFAC